ncbi:uncharacterized protein K452DRAFT_202701, partial [Aplosporella prunicola CBS 121167]
RTLHRTSYPEIDPANPDNSASGKSVVISGGATGIGLNIARAFAAVGATTIILLARRQEVLDEAFATLRAVNLKRKIEVWTYCFDIRNAAATEDVFTAIRMRLGKDMDILVTSAAMAAQGDTTLESSTRPRTPGRSKIILDVTIVSAYMQLPGRAMYSASKAAFTNLMRHLQAEADRLPGAPIRIHSFHPGAIWTPATARAGVIRDAVEWDDKSLLSGFAAWLTRKAASFLKRRFVRA